MPAFKQIWLPALAAAAALALTGFAGAAQAQTKNCGCKPPPPPPPPPPSCNCTTPPTTVNVTVNTGSQSQSSAASSASARSGAGAGGGVWMPAQAPAADMVQGLDVDTGETETKRETYLAKRRVERRVLIQASCLDDRGAPHPASQVHPEREVTEGYDGEIFRCIAGTRLQATIGDDAGGPALSHGETVACDKMQALYHSPGGEVACRAQKPARDCNERSLLRRYGPGVKTLKLVREETYTATREQTTAKTRTAASAMMTLDGGVGGFH